MKPLPKAIAVLLLVAGAAIPCHATILVSNVWNTGVRTYPTYNDPNSPYSEMGTDYNSSGDLESAWFQGGGGTLAPVGAGGPLRGSGYGSSSASWTTYFTPEGSEVTLGGAGDQLKVTWVFTPTGVSASNNSQGLPVALVNSPSTARLTGDNSPPSAVYTGYAVYMNMGLTFNHSHPFQLMTRNSGSAALLSSSGAWTGVADGASNGNHGYDSGTQYTLVMTLSHNAANGLDIVATMTGGTLNNSGTASASYTDATPNGGSFSFDTFAIRPSNDTKTASQFDTSLFKVEFIPGSTPPTISLDPQSQSAFVGQDATMYVLASGTLPLTFQWYCNTNTPVPNATNSTLTLTNVQLSDAGGYSALVSNSFGSVTSAVAQLTVSTPVAPSIVTQPRDQTALPGQSVSFSVVAGGTEPFSYQWYYNTNTPLANANDPILMLTNVQPTDAGSYSVMVSNLTGAVTSTNAVLSVNTNPVAPVFISQPASQVVLVGGTASFTAMAAGSAPIGYLWNKNGAPIPGATSTTLTLTNVQISDDGSYILTASNSVGSVPSDAAVLTVTATLPLVNSAYNLAGFAQGTTGGGVLPDTNANYAKVYTATDLANALISKTVKIIEIMNDLNLGYNEIEASAKVASEPFRAHNPPKLHPVLLQTGVSLIDIQKKNGLTIFSANGATIRHATFNVKSAGNVIIRNLKFDQLWEWDEASKGNYDKNDWDFIDLGNSGTVSNIWIDHCTFSKSYDGIVDTKGGSYNITFSWCKYTGDDGATNTNSWVRQQINYLEQSPASYPMYNFLRTHGFSVEDIVAISQGHDKTHLIGATTDSANAAFRVTYHHDWFMNPWDRLPRLRAGNVHDYNIYVDDTLGLAARRLRDARAAAMSSANQNTLNNTYSFKPFLNGSISTEGGAMLVEKSVYIDCLTPLRNNQTDPSNPFYTGKILGLDTIYQMDSTVVRGNSTDPGNPLGPFQAPIIAFSWNLPGNQLPYAYNMDDPSQLQSIVTSPTAGAGAGVLTWAKTNWLITSYPASAPVIVADPQSQAMTIGGGTTFTVVAGGSQPLFYQWYFNTNIPIANATNPILTLANIQATNGGSYSVVVSNSAGSTNSAYAVLTANSPNHPPVPGTYAIATGQNVPASFPAANLLAVGSDPDGNAFSLTAVSAFSTNNGAVDLAANQVTYSPPTDYAGSDLFTYTLTDTLGASATGSVAVVVVSSNNITLSLAGNPTLANGLFQAPFAGVPNLSYTVDRTTNLSGPWELGYTNIVAGANGLFQLIDTNNPPAPARFYRVRYW